MIITREGYLSAGQERQSPLRPLSVEQLQPLQQLLELPLEELVVLPVGEVEGVVVPLPRLQVVHLVHRRAASPWSASGSPALGSVGARGGQPTRAIRPSDRLFA